MTKISRRQVVLMGTGVTLYLAVADVSAVLATPAEADAEIQNSPAERSRRKARSPSICRRLPKTATPSRWPSRSTRR